MTKSATTKVLYVVNGEFYAGAERVQDLLAQQLPDFGFEVAFACLKDGIFDEKRSAKNAALYSMPMKSRIDLTVSKHLADLVTGENYRLIHTHTPRAALAGQLASRLSRTPMVHHVHSPSEQDTETGWRNIRNSLVEKLSLRQARKLIPVSESLEKYLLDKGYPSTIIHRVCNGVPVQETTRRLFSEGDQLTIGTVALFRPRKGIEALLEAMAQMHSSGRPVRLHAVGPFETAAYENSVKQLTAQLGLTRYVTWTGFTSDVTAQFSQMHLFVLPSLFGEGMPMVVLEAMAVGLPIVSTRVEGIPEVVREEQDGLLAIPGNAVDMARALTRFTDHEFGTVEMGNSGQQRQRELFSDVAMARGIATVYREVLEP